MESTIKNFLVLIFLVVFSTALFSMESNEREVHKAIHNRIPRYLLSDFADDVPERIIMLQKRKPGSGPTGGILEISPFVKSIKIFEHFINEKSNGFDFVFFPQKASVYVEIGHKTLGHSYIRNEASKVKDLDCGYITTTTTNDEEALHLFYCNEVPYNLNDPYGGTITRKGEYFRSDEMSGHFGVFWCDEIRYNFIDLMKRQGIKIIHEPSYKETRLNGTFYLEKALAITGYRAYLDKEENRDKVRAMKDPKFRKMDNEELELYQKEWLEKYISGLRNYKNFLMEGEEEY